MKKSKKFKIIGIVNPGIEDKICDAVDVRIKLNNMNYIGTVYTKKKVEDLKTKGEYDEGDGLVVDILTMRTLNTAIKKSLNLGSFYSYFEKEKNI